MIAWLTWTEVLVAAAAAVLCLAFALLRKPPMDLTLGAIALVEVLLIVQVVVAIAAPSLGNPIVGSALEFWVYLVSAVLIPPLAALWALVERSRWSNAVLAVAAFAVAVMAYRMHEIWHGES